MFQRLVKSYANSYKVAEYHKEQGYDG